MLCKHRRQGSILFWQWMGIHKRESTETVIKGDVGKEGILGFFPWNFINEGKRITETPLPFNFPIELPVIKISVNQS